MRNIEETLKRLDHRHNRRREILMSLNTAEELQSFFQHIVKSDKKRGILVSNKTP